MINTFPAAIDVGTEVPATIGVPATVTVPATVGVPASGRGPMRARGWSRGRGRGFRGRSGRRGRGRGRRRPAVIEPGFPKRCEICQTTLQSKFEFDKHSIGKRHLKNLRKEEILKQHKADGPKTADDKSSEDSKHISVNTEKARRVCTLCHVEFTSDNMEKDHMKGARHLNNVKKAAMGGVIKVTKRKPKNKLGKCDLCSVVYTSQIMMDNHIYGRRHRSNCTKNNIPIPTRPNKRDLDEVTSTTETKLDAKRAKTSPLVAPATTVPGKSATGESTISTSQAGVAKRAIALPPPKKLEKRAPITLPEVPAYQILEKQAEEAYEHYLAVAKANPEDTAGNQTLYIKYQEIYKAYEAAYVKYVTGTNAQGSG